MHQLFARFFILAIFISIITSANSDECRVNKCCPNNLILSNNQDVNHNIQPCLKPNSSTVSSIKDNYNGCSTTNEYFQCDKSSVAAVLPIDTVQINSTNLVYESGDYVVVYDKEKFCIDHEHGNQEETVIALVCVQLDINDMRMGDQIGTQTTTIGMIISMPFLLLTFTAYALYPDRNLHMKALMCYVLTLMLGYLVFVIIQLSQSQFDPITCTIMGYGGLFFFTCSFFWMNVICIDIWFTFRGFRGYIGNKNSERKRFYFYMLYAFGMSILHIVVVFCIDSNTDESDWFHPDIGNGQCFLKGGFPELLYFYGPLATIITINVTLYSITAFKIRVIKRETSMLRREDSRRHSYENDKQKFNLYLKLLFGMGVNWSMEVISWAVNWGIGEIPQAIWYITDFCNAIYGVFIFFIFVFRRNVWKLMRKRYYNFIGRPYFGQTTMTGIANATSTNTTSYSLSSSTRAGTENLYTPEPAQPASPAWTSHSDKHEVS